MAIGSLDTEGKLAQLREYTTCLVRSGYRGHADVRDDVTAAILDVVRDPARADELAAEYIGQARAQWAADAAGWPGETDYDRLQAAFADLRGRDIVVLEAVEDHWEANDVLVERAAAGARPRGVAYFTQTDVWHAVEHGMLELNIWHGDAANVLDTDELLAEVIETLAARGLPAHFDEGRVEVGVRWERRP